MISLPDWDHRFKQQAGWTTSIRSYLFKMAGVAPDYKILDIGCGTGVLLTEIKESYGVQPIGIDINFPSVHYASSIRKLSTVVCADAYHLPVADNSIDIVLFHFVLLWLKEPVKVLSEVNKCLKPDGWLFCLAEPDHASRVDYPPPLDEIGKLQTTSLKQQGADIMAGRKLGDWIHKAGLNVIETGIFGSQWSPSNILSESQAEWEWLSHDGINLDKSFEFSARSIDTQARSIGSRILSVPTYYACARKK